MGNYGCQSVHLNTVDPAWAADTRTGFCAGSSPLAFLHIRFDKEHVIDFMIFDAQSADVVADAIERAVAELRALRPRLRGGQVAEIIGELAETCPTVGESAYGTQDESTGRSEQGSPEQLNAALVAAVNAEVEAA